MKVMTVIAEIAHNKIREHCIANQMEAPAEWNDLSDELRESSLYGVATVIKNPDITAEKMHNTWMKHKKAQGWKFGKKKDVENKLHPCMVPFKKLPKNEQKKDTLFIETVKAEMVK